MEIKVFTDIDNPELAIGWRSFASSPGIFPQYGYEWASTWWKYQGKNLSLYCVAVINENQEMVVLAPLCIEKRLGLRMLRSFPFRFGDFYDFLSKKEVDQAPLFNQILAHLQTFLRWDVVRIEKVPESSQVYSVLNQAMEWTPRLASSYVSFPLDYKTWDDYLKSLKTKARYNIQARMRKLEATGVVSFSCIDSWDEFVEVEHELDNMYAIRLHDTHRKRKSASEVTFRKELIRSGFDNHNLILFLLKLNQKVIAYRMGFNFDGYYFDWNISIDIDHKKLHPGICSLGWLTTYLIENNYLGINLMSGVYPWKLDFSPDHTSKNNYSFYLSSGGFISRIYNRIYLNGS